MAEQAQAVADWLNGRDRTSARPASVTIGRTTYVGAYYTQERDLTPGTRAYNEARHAMRPLTYTITAYYLLGRLPASYLRSSRTVYIDAADARFYVGGWWEPDDFRPGSYIREPDGTTRPQTLADIEHYHPFGRHFLLMPDEVGVTTQDDEYSHRYGERTTVRIERA